MMRPTKMNVEVTEYIDGVTFYARDVKDGVGVLKNITEYMSKLNPSTAFQNYDSKTEYAKEKAICAGLYDDGGYYRCKILQKRGNDENRSYKVAWIDFGQTGVVARSHLLPIPDKTIRDMPGQAMKCVLAGVRSPPESAEVYYRTAVERLWMETDNRTLNIEILRRGARDIKYVRCTVDGVCLNELLVEDGVLKVEKGRNIERESPQFKAKLEKLAAQARQNHVGIYEFGDAPSDDEDDKDRGRGGRGKRRAQN